MLSKLDKSKQPTNEDDLRTISKTAWLSKCAENILGDFILFYNKPELLFYYKGVVACPPLQMVDDVLAVQKCSPQSVQVNTVFNTFMELEKLTLSKTKCHNLHMGKHRSTCRNLQVHGSPMHEAKSEKYLGDIVHKSGSLKPNIAKRLSRGWGRINEIMALIKEAPLGRKRIEAGLLLRKSLLINATLFNSEAWHGLTKSQIQAFEKIDESLDRESCQNT